MDEPCRPRAGPHDRHPNAGHGRQPDGLCRGVPPADRRRRSRTGVRETSEPSDRDMSLLRHIRACNAHDPTDFMPLVMGEKCIGTIRRDNATLLTRFPSVFAVEDARVRLIAGGTPQQIGAAVDAVIEALVQERRVSKWRNEVFTVTE